MASGPFEFSTASWSPDSRQFAFLASAGDENLFFDDGWLFGGSALTPAGSPAASNTCQLWVATVALGKSERIDETAGRLSIPCWFPDGKSLLYVRFRPASLDGLPDMPELSSNHEVEGTLELVRRYRTGRSDQVYQRQGSWPLGELLRLPVRSTACSDNGLHVALPWVGSTRLIVLSLSDRKVEAEYPDADHANFSPGNRYLAFGKTTEPFGVMLTPIGKWTEGSLLCPHVTVQEPICWSRGGTHFFIHRRGDQMPPSRRHDAQEPSRMEIRQVSTTDGSERTIQGLMLNGEEPASKSRAMLAFDPAKEMLYISVLQSGFPPVIESLDTETLDKKTWHPLCDELSEHRVPLGAQSVSADSKYLLFRYGLPEWCAPLALYDLPRNRWRTWVSNHSLRVRGLWALATTARRIIRKVPAEAPSPFIVTEKISFRDHLRVAEELTSPLDLFDRPKDQASRDDQQRADIDRLAKLGLEMLESDRRINDIEWSRRRAELLLFFHYAREDYGSALVAAGQVEENWPADEPIDHRMALATVRVQCMIGSGKGTTARPLLSRLIQERARQLAGADGNQERRELLQSGIDLGAVTKNLATSGSDPILERLNNLLDIAEESTNARGTDSSSASSH
ncbi:MAG: hypothetical protein U1D30_16765 [Planctomycetota bacterium]